MKQFSLLVLENIFRRICTPMVSCNSDFWEDAKKSHDGFVHLPLRMFRHGFRVNVPNGLQPLGLFFLEFLLTISLRLRKKGDLGVDSDFRRGGLLRNHKA